MRESAFFSVFPRFLRREAYVKGRRAGEEAIVKPWHSPPLTRCKKSICALWIDWKPNRVRPTPQAAVTPVPILRTRNNR